MEKKAGRALKNEESISIETQRRQQKVHWKKFLYR